MIRNKHIKITVIISSIFLLILITYLTFFQSNNENLAKDSSDESLYNSNILKDVMYVTKDSDGNEYIVKATKGEIDFSNPNIIYLTKVNVLVKMNNSDEVIIFSDYGKYNSENFDTILSKNVLIKYLNNNIKGEYLDFSITRNSLIISKNVVYNNLSNTLRADVIEMDIKSKDTKIFMYEKNKKVNIKN